MPNPSAHAYEIEITNPELTFIGVPNQPDFAEIKIIFFPNRLVIELKSLKQYFFQFRNKLMSYERLINVIFSDIMNVYQPRRLKIVMTCNARGGIQSKLTIDSEQNRAKKKHARLTN